MGAVEVEFEDGRGSGDISSADFFSAMFKDDDVYGKFKSNFDAAPASA